MSEPESLTDRPLVLAWEPALEDLLEAHRLRPLPRSRSFQWLVRGGLAFSVVVVVGGALLHESAYVAAGVAVGAAYAYLAGPGQRRILRRSWHTNAALREPLRMVVTPETGLRIERQGYVAEYAWSRFDGLLEGDGVFVLLLAGQRFYHVVAKRGLADAGDLPRFRSTVHAGVATARAGSEHT